MPKTRTVHSAGISARQQMVKHVLQYQYSTEESFFLYSTA